MTAFLKHIEPFRGDGSRNEAGQTLEEFLAEYDANRYQNPCSTADVVVFKYHGEVRMDKLELLMIRRKNHPSIGRWALPGGFAEIHEDLEQSAIRELEEETGLTGIPVEQLYTWGEEWRDPRTRIITTAYLALVDDSIQEPKAGDDAAQAMWAKVHCEKVGDTEVSDDNKREMIYYHLHLQGECEGEKIELHADIRYSKNRQGILRQPKYEVIANDGIAFDHPRFIVQALRRLEQMKE